MTRILGNPRILPGMLLAVLLLGAHFSVAVHAFEHDVSALQGKVCSTCVTAAQLGTASVDHPVIAGPQHAVTRHSPVVAISGASLDVPVACQRGPPTPL